MTSPMLDVVILYLKLRAMSLRRKFTLASAACTRSVVALATPASPFTTRETVLRLTPAKSATCSMVGRVASLGAERRCVVIVIAGNSKMTSLSILRADASEVQIEPVLPPAEGTMGRPRRVFGCRSRWHLQPALQPHDRREPAD